MPWKEISTFTSVISYTVYLLHPEFVCDQLLHFDQIQFIHSSPSLMSQSFQPTSFSHLSSEPIISLSSIRSGVGLPSLDCHSEPTFLAFLSCKSSILPPFHDAIGICVYTSSHLFLSLQSAIFHSSPSTFSTRWHHYFPQDSELHQSYQQNPPLFFKRAITRP